MERGTPEQTLRGHLRGSTHASHDRLDSAMRAAHGWETRGDYARFLKTQYSARAPVESWLAANAPADLRPPEQTPLIAADLADLGETAPDSTTPLSFASEPDDEIETVALGAAWVLAGSALGNLSILKELERDDRADWPRAFLSSRAMLEFWSGLRRRIESPVEADKAATATRAATAVFDHFLDFAGRAEAPKAGAVP